VNINGEPPLPKLGNDTTLCVGHTLLLSSDADGFTSATWQDGSSAKTYAVQSAGIYTVNEINRCGMGVDSIVVSYLDLPQAFNLGNDTLLCPGETLMLTAPDNTYSRMWQDGTDQANMIADRAQTYFLEMSN